MKSFSIMLALCALALARERPSDGEITRQAEEACGRLENIHVDKCKTNAKHCVTDSFNRNITEIKDGDKVFWSYIQDCTIGRSVSIIYGDSPKNFAAVLPDTRIFCIAPHEGNMKCVSFRYNESQEQCKERTCHSPHELADICVKHGGCVNCKAGNGPRSADGKFEESFDEFLTFDCRLRENEDPANSIPPQEPQEFSNATL
ncbi:hypothetical protein VB005_00246 [Metarhizium brunneum]